MFDGCFALPSNLLAAAGCPATFSLASSIRLPESLPIPFPANPYTCFKLFRISSLIHNAKMNVASQKLIVVENQLQHAAKYISVWERCLQCTGSFYGQHQPLLHHHDGFCFIGIRVFVFYFIFASLHIIVLNYGIAYRFEFRIQ